jgi:uncharacterized membrane protein YkvA (DUF1232 family)
MEYFKKLTQFIKDVANDPRIPEADKTLLLVLVALILSPIDLIPDWIPVIGLLDDLLMLSIILDYFFNHLESSVLLSHYPWGMKSFIRVKKISRSIAFFTPRWIKNKIWKYRPPSIS